MACPGSGGLNQLCCCDVGSVPVWRVRGPGLNQLCCYDLGSVPVWRVRGPGSWEMEMTQGDASRCPHGQHRRTMVRLPVIVMQRKFGKGDCWSQFVGRTVRCWFDH